MPHPTENAAHEPSHEHLPQSAQKTVDPGEAFDLVRFHRKVEDALELSDS
jgi:hypothetical protein